jgi:hypothetical protein
MPKALYYSFSMMDGKNTQMNLLRAVMTGHYFSEA